MNSKRRSIHSILSNFFLKKHTLRPSTLQMLKEVYPTVNWRRVDFYEGLPWYTPFIAPYVNAQALPQFYSFSRYRIYLTKFDESRAQCLSDIVHEGFHVMQAMEFAKGYGLGILRGFTVYYSALYIKYGYRNNPFEIPAYDQEFRFLDFCEKHHQHGIQPAVDPAIFKNISQETPLVFRHFEFSYRERFVLLVLGFIFCLLLLPLKPLLDALIFLVRLVFFKRRRLAGEVRRL